MVRHRPVPRRRGRRRSGARARGLDGDPVPGHSALHHFELRADPAIYRAFLLPDCLEVDIGVTPAADFGARGPSFRPVFGEPVGRPYNPPPDRDHLVGLAWHDVLHARTSIERRRPWQAEYCISDLRDHTLALACLRHGVPAVYAEGVDALPEDVTSGFEGALVGSLDGVELRRALRVAADGFLRELGETDPGLGQRLRASITELAHATAPPR